MNDPHSTPTCHVIAGPNGAGKTTFAMRYLLLVAGVVEFVNADSIARGLSPLNEESVQGLAARLFLERVRDLEHRRLSFAFETTLSGRGHVALLRKLRAGGYRIELNYLWIPSADFSVQRVLARVASGGHGIPSATIVRRYPRSVRNLVDLYMPLADYAAVWDNSGSVPRAVCEMVSNSLTVHDQTVWKQIAEQTP